MQATQGKKMPALLPELVNMASDPAVSTGDLLRRALVAARRLDAPELVDWIGAELNGYKNREIPDYRIIRGQIMVMNPVRGLIPFRVRNAEAFELLSRHPEMQSIPELEELGRSDGELGRYFPPAVEQRIMQGMQLPMRPRLCFSTVQVKGIVEKVRNRILEWALDLEGRGVLGEGMTFTQQEKQTVQQIHNHFGNVSGSQIQISSNGSTQTQANTTMGRDLDALRGLKPCALPLTVALCKVM
jgi:hypothetical protein